MPRPTPFDLVFAGFAQDRFPGIRTALESGNRDAANRDAFLIEREAMLLLHELRPRRDWVKIDQLAACCLTTPTCSGKWAAGADRH
jgi:hypothetical protein